MKAPSFSVFGGTWTLRLWPTLITLVMMAIMAGLGCWQIQRLHWKEGLIADMRARMQERPVDVGLSSIPPEGVPSMDYHPATASGAFAHQKELFLNAISKQHGEGGYHVLTPLTLEDGRVLLVDRGWLPYAARPQPGSKDHQDDISRPQGPVTVNGILRVPHARAFMQPENKPEKGEWYFYDLAAMGRAAGVSEFLPFVLEADDALNRSGYPVGGQTRIDLPNNHLGYAITWFTLAGVLLVVYGISGWRKVPSKV